MDEVTEAVVVRKKGRGGKENFPTTIPQEVKDNHELISTIMRNNLLFYRLPRVKDDDELAERLGFFFETCMNTGQIPTVEKMCLAIGYAHQSVWAWEAKVEPCSARRLDLVKKAKQLLGSIDAELAVSGKINPIVYIFRSKNFFGMKDTQEHILTPNNPLGDMVDPAAVAKRISATVVED